MTHNQRKPNSRENLIKFYVPRGLKRDLQMLAISRNIALSALLRLVVTEYVKSKN
jgi:hypothetical protein